MRMDEIAMERIGQLSREGQGWDCRLPRVGMLEEEPDKGGVVSRVQKKEKRGWGCSGGRRKNRLVRLVQ